MITDARCDCGQRRDPGGRLGGGARGPDPVGGAPPRPSAQGARGFDARGLTVMPGFIDAHRHIINGNEEQWFKEQASVRMREFLEDGYTTLMSGGGPVLASSG